MGDKIKELHDPLDIYLADEVAAAHSLISIKEQQMQRMQDEINSLVQQKQHLMTSVHRLEMIALDESYRQEAHIS